MIPESQIPNLIGLAILLGCCGRYEVDIIDRAEYEKLFPKINTGNQFLDILMTQLKICNSSIDDILFCYNGDYEDIEQELQDIFWLKQFNEIDNPTIDGNEKKSAYEKILEMKSKIPLNIESKFEARLPFSMHEGFTQSLASDLCLLRIIELEAARSLEEAKSKDDAELNLMKNYDYLTRIAISVGALKGVFMYSADRFFSEKPELSIHQKGAMARKEKYRKKKEEAFKIFQNGNFYSFAECAREIYESMGVKNPNTVANWLSDMSKQKK